MEILKVGQVIHPVCWTDKGNLGILIRKGEKEYRFMLDSVPMDDETDRKLNKLFPDLILK